MVVVLKEAPGVRKRELEFDFGTLAVKNRGSQGNLVTKHKVQKVVRGRRAPCKCGFAVRTKRTGRDKKDAGARMPGSSLVYWSLRSFAPFPALRAGYAARLS